MGTTFVGAVDMRNVGLVGHSRGGEAVAVELDMTDTESILACVDRAEEAYGTVTILINNAGSPTLSGRTRCRSTSSTG